MIHKPPKWILNFIERFCDEKMAEGIAGDLYHLFEEDIQNRGVLAAKFLFIVRGVSFMRLSLLRFNQKLNLNVMLKSDIVFAWRSLQANKMQAMINFFGLGIGIAAAVIMLLYVGNETSYDQFNSHKDNIYRLVYLDGDYQGGGMAKIMSPMRAKVRDQGQVVSSVRFNFFGNTTFRYREKVFTENQGFAADPEFQDVFDFKSLEGNPKSALETPNQIVITQTMARKYFGDDQAMGQVLRLSNASFSHQSFVVGAILEDIPKNSHIGFDFLVPIANYNQEILQNWQRRQSYTYLLLQPNADPGSIALLATQAFLANTPDAPDRQGDQSLFRMQPLSEIYLKSKYHREVGPTGDIIYVYIAFTLALFILLIAGINFINLATARASIRLKEIGIRRANGASKVGLIRLYLVEAVFTVLVSLLLSLGIIYAALPSFNSAMDTWLEFNFKSHFPLMVAGGVLMGLIAGLYPAIQMARFDIADILRSNLRASSKSRLRRLLVIFQYTLSILLILSTVFIWQQVDYMKTKELGFQKSNIITLSTSSQALIADHQSFMAELRRNPGIANVSFTGNLPGGGDWGIPITFEGFREEELPPFRVLEVDENFLKTFDIQLVEGRDFSAEIQTDQQSAYIINEEGARQLGWDEAVGKQAGMIRIGREMGRIIGVVEDFHFRSMHEKIEPIALFCQPEWSNTFSIRFTENVNVQEVIGDIQRKWKSFDAAAPFEVKYFDQKINGLYAREDRLSYISRSFMVLSFIIASIGLIGLASFSLTSRTKELGIRKVMGASTWRITRLVSVEFLSLIAVSAILALPAAFYVAFRWLENFAYSTSISPVSVFATLGGVLVLSLLTISYQVLQVAVKNPVDSLRYE